LFSSSSDATDLPDQHSTIAISAPISPSVVAATKAATKNSKKHGGIQNVDFDQGEEVELGEIGEQVNLL
jgi:hypothetical protein